MYTTTCEGLRVTKNFELIHIVVLSVAYTEMITLAQDDADFEWLTTLSCLGLIPPAVVWALWATRWETLDERREEERVQ